MRIPVPFSSDLIVGSDFPATPRSALIAWVGNGFDLWWTPDVNERELRRQYNQYLASPSSRVRAYMVFEVSSTEIDPRVSYVHVTGPGLPSVGLNLVRSDPQFPRDYLIFRVTSFIGTPSPPNAAPLWPSWWTTLTISAISSRLCARSGRRSRPIELCLLLSRRRRQRPRPEDARPEGRVARGGRWYAARDRFFGQFTLDPTFQFTMSNVLDTSAGSPFVAAKVSLKWRLPTNPEVLPEGVSYGASTTLKR